VGVGVGVDIARDKDAVKHEDDADGAEPHDKH